MEASSVPDVQFPEALAACNLPLGCMSGQRAFMPCCKAAPADRYSTQPPTQPRSPKQLGTAHGFRLNDCTSLLTSRLSCCSLACASSAAAAASPCSQRNGISGSSLANRRSSAALPNTIIMLSDLP